MEKLTLTLIYNLCMYSRGGGLQKLTELSQVRTCYCFKEFGLIHHMAASAEGATAKRAVREGRHGMFT